MTHELEEDIRVAIDTRILPLACEEVEHLTDIGHVEVTAQTEVLCLPVVASQERMHVFQSALARGRISQMSHIHLADVRHRSFRLIFGGVSYLMIDRLEHLGDGILTLGLLAIHILVPWFLVELDTSQTCTLLTSVMLLLHHQIELLKGIAVSAVFLLVVFEWLAQSDHCNATFVFQLIHHIVSPSKTVTAGPVM